MKSIDHRDTRKGGASQQHIAEATNNTMQKPQEKGLARAWCKGRQMRQCRALEAKRVSGLCHVVVRAMTWSAAFARGDWSAQRSVGQSRAGHSDICLSNSHHGCVRQG